MNLLVGNRSQVMFQFESIEPLSASILLRPGHPGNQETSRRTDSQPSQLRRWSVEKKHLLSFKNVNSRK